MTIMSTYREKESQGRFWDSINLIEELFEKDGMRRHKARVQLEKAGRKVTPLLIGALKSENTNVRWEVTKALIEIKDPLAADALTDALMDEDYEVRWLAAEALIALGKDALKPLLRKLLGHYDSTFLRIGAHHVLEYLKNNESLDEETTKVLHELNTILPFGPFPLAAKNALESLRRGESKQNEPNRREG
jgi:HEAT repeat protein